MLEKNEQWEVVQVIDSITPGNAHYNEKSRLAKTIQKDGTTWGSANGDQSQLAHENSRMTCYACHSSWAPTCYGCHLPMTANQKMPMLHNEGLTTRNWTSYDFQILRDDVYSLAIDGTVTGHRVAPVRSACAVLVSSQNNNRDWIYYQQQTISAEGFSGQAFSTFVPHTVRAKETKQCTDCHVSKAGDNNAWMTQLILLGTNFMNFMGRYIYVATGNKGYEAVAVTENDEPPAVIGSDLQKLAYPDDYNKHVKNNRELKEAYGHAGSRFWMFRRAANISTPPWGKAACASTTLRMSMTRTFLSARLRLRSRLWASASTSQQNMRWRWRLPRRWVWTRYAHIARKTKSNRST